MNARWSAEAWRSREESRHFAPPPPRWRSVRRWWWLVAPNIKRNSALLAAGDVDLVVCLESSLQVAVGLVERRLRQRHLRTTSEAASRHVQENHMESQQETRDFGEVLRHELNNPLTGILG
jgi:signal transduction histidine kinase